MIKTVIMKEVMIVIEGGISMGMRLESRSYVGAVTGAALASAFGVATLPAAAGEPLIPCSSPASTVRIVEQGSVLPDLAARIEKLRVSLDFCDEGSGAVIAQFSNRWCNERCG
jgi:hypothetical protein